MALCTQEAHLFATSDATSRLFQRYIASGDTAILDALLAGHLDGAYSQARRLLGNDNEAEDAVQEAVIRLVRTVDKYDGSISFGAWFGCLIHSAGLNAIRSRRRRRRHEMRAGAHRIFAGQNAGSDHNDAVRAAVSELPERYRATIDLHYFAGLSQRDTALALGIKEDAVAKRLERARDALHLLLRRRGVSIRGATVAAILASSPAYTAPSTLSQTTTAVVTTVSHGQLPGSVVSTAAAWSGKMVVGALAATVAVIAGGAIHRASEKNTTRESTVRSEKSWLRQWDFNNDELPKDLSLQFGTWHRVPNGGPDGSACAESDSANACADLDLAADVLPLKLAFKWSNTRDDQPKNIHPFPAVNWNDLTVHALFHHIGELNKPAAGQWHETVVYITDRSIDTYYNGLRATLTYSKSPKSARLHLFLSPFQRVDDVIISSITPNEVPDVGKYLDAVDAVPIYKRIGMVKLSGVDESVDFLLSELSARQYRGSTSGPQASQTYRSLP
jgi:RNA polymerase sigma-70 factor, ECF subfamily